VNQPFKWISAKAVYSTRSAPLSFGSSSPVSWAAFDSSEFYTWPSLKCSDYDVLRKRYLLYLKSVSADLCEMCCAHGGRDLLWSRQEWACLVGGFNLSLQWHLLICVVIPWFFICVTTSAEGLGTAVLSECLESCNFQGQTFYTDRYINLVIASCTTSKTFAATHSSTSGSVKCVLSFLKKYNRVVSLV